MINMQLFVLLTSLVSLAIVQAGIINEKCDGELFHGVYHNREELLKNDLDRPYLLDVDHYNDILYFSYDAGNDTCKTARLDLHSKKVKDIERVYNGFAQTVDQVSQTVYIAGGSVIYKYNYKSDLLDIVVNTGKLIWNVYFKDDLYFATCPDQELYVYNYKTEELKKFEDLNDTTALNFAIDRDGVMFYSNSTGMYSQQKGTKDVVVYKTCPLFTIRQLSTDKHGKVYACLQDGIYAVDKDKVSLEKVLDIQDAYGVTFDRNNYIIYSDSARLYRLIPNKSSNCNTVAT